MAGVLCRDIREDELDVLLELYRHLHEADVPLPERGRVEEVWGEMLSGSGMRCLVGEVGGRVVGSCCLVMVPNLTRGARPYGVIENVVTHADFRRRGVGGALLRHALGVAWEAGCYKVMLMTGRKTEAVTRFYEGAGFRGDAKNAFVATAEGMGKAGRSVRPSA